MASPYHFLVKTAFFICAFLCVTLLFHSIFFSTPSGTLSCVACGTSSIPEHRKLSSNNHSNETTNVSHIVFGIAGSAKTWNKRRPYNELWWQPNVTRGFVWLDEMPNSTWPDTSPPYKISANTSMFKYTCWYGSRSAVRITRIVKESFDLGLDNVRWFVMGDDDSVFFVENLVMVLANYDHNQMYYIGDNSESVEQDVIHSYNVAYGGGGFAISYALAKELVRILDGCIDRYASFFGSDQKIQGCLSEIGVPLTKELGFHQADVKGNLYGLLAAHPVAPLVSLHHVDYVEPIFPPMNRSDSLNKLYSAFKTDPGRIVQHSFCYDTNRNWSVSVSWGYTIQIYPSLVTAKQLETTFQTFKSWKSLSDGPFTFDTRVLSPDPCERPLIYFLDRIERVGGGESLTTYKRYMEIDKTCYQSQYSALLDVQSVNVSSSTLEPYVWKMAPRRQCCEIINGVNQKNDTVQVKIRSCKQFESVTPPI